MKLEDIKIDLSSEPIDEKNWDIKKWRKETPMDYLKALQILNMCDNDLVRDTIFLNIYQITRLYIPDVLYKFYSLTDDETLNRTKLQTLINRQIFLSDLNEFNDPFDGKCFYYDSKQLECFERLKHCNGKIIDDFSKLFKGASLTANNEQSMPMWANYSNNHQGFCVSYDMKSNELLRRCTFPIQYICERIDITKLMKEQMEKIIKKIDSLASDYVGAIILSDLTLVYMVTLLCNLKLDSWASENEFRCSAGSTARGMPYFDAIPKEIYIGMKCKDIYVEELSIIGKTLGIPVYKMQFNEYNSAGRLHPKRIM